MALLLQLALCTAIVLLASTATGEHLTISPSLKECDQKGNLIFCDFKNTVKDVYMGPLVDKAISKMFIYSAKNITLNESTCVSIAFHNITSVSVQKDEPFVCPEAVELSVKFTKIDRLPNQVTKLYLEESSMESLKTNKISKLTVVNSNISSIEMESLSIGGINMVFQNSKINLIRKLVIPSNASVLFQRTQINSTLTEAFIIHRNARVTFKDTVIQSLLDSRLILESDALVTIEGNCDLNIMSQTGNIKEDNTQASLLIVVSVILVSSIIVNVICFVYIWTLKRKHKGKFKSTDTEMKKTANSPWKLDSDEADFSDPLLDRQDQNNVVSPTIGEISHKITEGTKNMDKCYWDSTALFEKSKKYGKYAEELEKIKEKSDKITRQESSQQENTGSHNHDTKSDLLRRNTRSVTTNLIYTDFMNETSKKQENIMQSFAKVCSILNAAIAYAESLARVDLFFENNLECIKPSADTNGHEIGTSKNNENKDGFFMFFYKYFFGTN